MTEIRTGTSIVTLVNVFATTPENFDEFLKVASAQTPKVVQRPGCISANIHVSRDKLRVVNYAQWESEEAFRAMLADPELMEGRAAMEAIATPDVHLYDVSAIYEGPAARNGSAA
ncbi:putative quinol monooxygenase [Nonomuraea jabiensis]|uniref:putative quinol monooxygenase n=1 Tax=Nonomuraea jabiensis TaxID=882448 RepID=UPI003D74618A